MDAHRRIKKGDRVTFKPEYSNQSDDGVTFRATEDESDNGSIHIRSEVGLFINPVCTVMPYMLSVVEE